MSEKYTATRYAVKLDPPSILLEYEDPLKKRRVRMVKMSQVGADPDLDRLTKKVMCFFPRKLDLSTVSFHQVKKLVQYLLDHPSPTSSPNTSPRPSNHGKSKPWLPSSQGHLEGLDSKSAADVQHQHATGWHIGTTVSHDRAPQPATALASALDELDRELNDMGVAVSTSSDRPLSVCTSASSPAVPAGADLSSSDREQDPSNRISNDISHSNRLRLDADDNTLDDLNKVSEWELQLAKKRMEGDFLKHRLKPGDPGYEYDKQVDFGPADETNEWDDDNDATTAETEVDASIDWQEITQAVSKIKQQQQPPQEAQQDAQSEEATASSSARRLTEASSGDSRSWPCSTADRHAGHRPGFEVSNTSLAGGSTAAVPSAGLPQSAGSEDSLEASAVESDGEHSYGYGRDSFDMEPPPDESNTLSSSDWP